MEKSYKSGVRRLNESRSHYKSLFTEHKTTNEQSVLGCPGFAMMDQSFQDVVCQQCEEGQPNVHCACCQSNTGLTQDGDIDPSVFFDADKPTTTTIPVKDVRGTPKGKKYVPMSKDSSSRRRVKIKENKNVTIDQTEGIEFCTTQGYETMVSYNCNNGCTVLCKKGEEIKAIKYNNNKPMMGIKENKKMKRKVIKIKESDITKIVRGIISEQGSGTPGYTRLDATICGGEGLYVNYVGQTTSITINDVNKLIYCDGQPCTPSNVGDNMKFISVNNPSNSWTGEITNVSVPANCTNASNCDQYNLNTAQCPGVGNEAPPCYYCEPDGQVTSSPAFFNTASQTYFVPGVPNTTMVCYTDVNGNIGVPGFELQSDAAADCDPGGEGCDLRTFQTIMNPLLQQAPQQFVSQLMNNWVPMFFGKYDGHPNGCKFLNKRLGIQQQKLQDLQTAGTNPQWQAMLTAKIAAIQAIIAECCPRTGGPMGPGKGRRR